MKAIFKKLVVLILQNQVKRLIKQNDFKIIALTGSVGKTTTKLAIAHVLQSKYQVLVHEGNYNTEIGMPLSLFSQTAPTNISDIGAWIKIIRANESQIKSDYPYQYVLMEWGADHPGDIAHFASYINPDIGVLTAVAPAHTDGFGSVENILLEKWNVVSASQHAYINTDFEIIQHHFQSLPADKQASIQTYGLNPADVQFIDLEFDLNQKAYQAGFKRGLETRSGYQIPVIARHALLAPLVASAIGFDEGLTEVEVKHALRTLPTVSGRLNLLDGVNDSLLIDDSYNASSASMLAALAMLSELPATRHIAVLGSINELGSLSVSEHKLVGQAANQVDILLTIGDDANTHLSAAAIENGLDSNSVHKFESPRAAGEWLRNILHSGDIVLIKGSQNKVFSEEATKVLLKNPKDSQKLVRQSDWWMAEKSKQFDDLSD